MGYLNYLSHANLAVGIVAFRGHIWQIAGFIYQGITPLTVYKFVVNSFYASVVISALKC